MLNGTIDKHCARVLKQCFDVHDQPALSFVVHVGLYCLHRSTQISVEVLLYVLFSGVNFLPGSEAIIVYIRHFLIQRKVYFMMLFVRSYLLGKVTGRNFL